MRAPALLPVLLLVRSLSLYGQTDERIPQEYIPRDTEEHWTVAFARFQGVNLSSENLYLTHSLPLLLRESLSGAHTHFFGTEERRGYQEWILRQERRRLGQTLQSLRQERDALFFQALSATERSEKLAAYDEKLAATVERVNTVRGMDPGLIEFPERKPILFRGARARIAEGGFRGDAGAPAAAAGLIEAAVLSPLRIAREEGVNLLIWGSLEEVQGYLYLEVRALDAHLGREVFFYSDAAEPEELYAGLEEATADLSRLLWGRGRASLAVETAPVGAQVYVEGVYAGRAPVQVDYLVPGPVELRVEAQGYLTELLRLELEPDALARELVVLEKRSPDPLWVTSDPPGAAIYDGSVWLGATPLVVQRPERLSRVALRLEGYPEKIVYLGPESGAQVSVSFALADPGPAELQARRRDAFYTAFGVFALSVPFPLFFWGATNDSYAASLLAGTYDEALRLAGQVEGYYNAYLATLGVSGALLVNMVVHLVRYIRAADRRE